MTLYAESSAVLAWLLGEPSGEAMGATLAAADQVIASDLLLVECDRALIRAVGLQALADIDATEAHGKLARVSSHWHRLRVSAEIIDRSRQPFPVEPVRSLDALHLASALYARSFLKEIELLSLDGRIRDNGRKLGFVLLPQAIER